MPPVLPYTPQGDEEDKLGAALGYFIEYDANQNGYLSVLELKQLIFDFFLIDDDVSPGTHASRVRGVHDFPGPHIPLAKRNSNQPFKGATQSIDAPCELEWRRRDRIRQARRMVLR